MEKEKTINILLAAAALALLGFFAFSVRIMPAPDNVAILTTTGMTCGSRVSGIEMALQRKKGVASVEIDPRGARVVVGYDSKKVEPEELAAAVTGMGFPSRLEESLSIDRYRAMNGRKPGGVPATDSCNCLARK